MATADIKKFTGFIAPDGSTHDTIKKATEYTKNLKVKEALAATLGESITPATHGSSVSQDDRDMFVVYPRNMPDFLLENREMILAAFNQDVTLRAPRKKKAPVAVVVTEAQTA